MNHENNFKITIHDDNREFNFKFFNREDFDKIVEWGKKYGEIL